MGILDTLLSIAPAAAQVGGYFLKRSAQKDADKKVQQELAKQALLNEAANTQRTNLVQQQIAQYDPATRVPALARKESEIVGRLQDVVTTAPSAVAESGYGGRVSTDYLRAKGERTADDLKYAIDLAKSQGKASAPGELTMNEGFYNADLHNAGYGVEANLRQGLGESNNRLNNIQPSGGKMLAGDLLQAGGLLLGNRQPTALEQYMKAKGGASQVRYGAAR